MSIFIGLPLVIGIYVGLMFLGSPEEQQMEVCRSVKKPSSILFAVSVTLIYFGLAGLTTEVSHHVNTTPIVSMQTRTVRHY